MALFGRKSIFEIWREAMISELMNAVLKKIPEKYPHMQYPQVLKAIVTGVSEAGAWEEELKLQDADGIRDCVLIHKKYSYTLQIIDDSGNRDALFPTIPSVVSSLQIPAGTVVAVGMMNGLPDPYILGECG